MKMKYFVLYCISDDGHIFEIYLKGKSMKHMQERIIRYSNGILCTNKDSIMTKNLVASFIREVNPKEYPQLTKRDFAIINENWSMDSSDYLDN